MLSYVSSKILLLVPVLLVLEGCAASLSSRRGDTGPSDQLGPYLQIDAINQELRQGMVFDGYIVRTAFLDDDSQGELMLCPMYLDLDTTEANAKGSTLKEFYNYPILAPLGDIAVFDKAKLSKLAIKGDQIVPTPKQGRKTPTIQISGALETKVWSQGELICLSSKRSEAEDIDDVHNVFRGILSYPDSHYLFPLIDGEIGPMELTNTAYRAQLDGSISVVSAEAAIRNYRTTFFSNTTLADNPLINAIDFMAFCYDENTHLEKFLVAVNLEALEDSSQRYLWSKGSTIYLSHSNISIQELKGTEIPTLRIEYPYLFVMAFDAAFRFTNTNSQGEQVSVWVLNLGKCSKGP